MVGGETDTQGYCETDLGETRRAGETGDLEQDSGKYSDPSPDFVQCSW